MKSVRYPKGPATAMQIGLLYESTRSALPWANLEQIVVHTKAEPLDHLRAAWQAMAVRHEALRLSFAPDNDGNLCLFDHPDPVIDIEMTDWSADPDPQARLAAFLHSDRLQGADPSHYPNWRVRCALLPQGRMAMVWTIHHALIDGTSMAIVLEDLFDLLAPAGPAAPAPQVAFSDLANTLATADKTQAREIFRDMFHDRTALVPFANGHGQTPARPNSLSAQLSPEDSAALRAAMQRMGVTPLTAFQAAWALVLARWTGQAEAVIGLVDSGRGAMPGLDRTVGCLISTLPLRVEFAQDQTIGTVLTGLRANTRRLRAQTHAGLGEIRRWIGASGQSPLFDTLLMYTRASLGEGLRKLGKGWDSRTVTLHEEGTAAATLAVYDDTSLHIVLEHDPERLPLARAERALAHLVALLRALSTAGPDDTLGQIAMLSTTETSQLLRLSQPATVAAGVPPCPITRFEDMARAQPETLALVDAASGHSLTYRELDETANALAHRLTAHGIGAEDIVALHMPRGPEFVVGLLAVLKSGAAVMPLDPDQPAAFLQGLIASCGARALIAPEGSALAQTHGSALAHLVPDPERSTVAPARPAPLAGRLAYVIHTSGSTGRPKGVMGLCGALSAHADAVQQTFDLTAQDRVLQFAGLGFDVMLEEIVPTLLVGARLVLRDAGSAASVSGLLDLVARHRISVLNLPASFWHVLVDDMTRRRLALPPSVRLMVTGSERINPNALAQWRKLAPNVPWINGYGPTEGTITCAAWRYDPGQGDTPEDVPIGRPLGHARLHLRAFDGTLAPFGAEAHLWVGGQAVTRGYMGQTDQTNAVYQPDPFSADGRLYCTGDLARWREDGQLQFLGRRDRQIKLRGHRIDLHQIENALGSLPEVHQAHAALDGDTPATARILAWVVCDAGPDGTDLAALRTQLTSLLPPYMIPTLLAVDQLPVGPNGKINTRALPRPLVAPALASPTEQTPKDQLALTIAQAMAQALELEFVPTDGNFHDYGGDSLLALRLTGLIEARTGHALRATDLHQYPTPASLARLLREGAKGPRFIIPIQPEGNRPPFFAVHVLGRNEELFRPLAAALGPDQPVFGLSVGLPRNLGEIDVQRTARVYFEELQRHHPRGPISLGAVSMAAYFAFELAQLLRAAGREVRVLAVLDAMGPDGRPSVQGMAKLRAHIGQLRSRGTRHLWGILRHRAEKFSIWRESRATDPDAINGFNLVAANVRAVETYVPLPYAGRLTIFRANESFWDSPQSIETGLGWASVAEGGFDLFDLPGNHLSILHPDKVDVLAQHLRRLMDAD